MLEARSPPAAGDRSCRPARWNRARSGPAVVALRDRLMRDGLSAAGPPPRDYDARAAGGGAGVPAGPWPDRRRRRRRRHDRRDQHRPGSAAEVGHRRDGAGALDARSTAARGISGSTCPISPPRSSTTARSPSRPASVIGKNVPDQRTPEFSDQMEYMVINPTWRVPRSIIVKEYLPLLQRNPNAVGHLQVIDRRGPRGVARVGRLFAPIPRATFPFAHAPAAVGRQCAGAGEVHVPEPLQHLSARHAVQVAVRARRCAPTAMAASGWAIRSTSPMRCWRVQTDDPEAEFERHLKTGSGKRGEAGRAGAGASGLFHRLSLAPRAG